MTGNWSRIMKLYAALLLGVVGLIADPLIAFGQEAPPKEPGLELRVMSFNIRNGKAKDGDNAWEHRKGFVGDVINDAELDVVGLQEAFRFQLDEIRKQRPEFSEVGEGRDGGERGEYSAILYRTTRFEAKDSGTFWLSDTPEVKSRHWGNRYLRICTWVLLEDKSSGQTFYVYNTHFDHQSQNARLRSAWLVAKRINERESASPFVLTGDFNAGEDNPVTLFLTGKNDEGRKSPVAVVDTFRSLHPEESVVGTGGGFEGRRDGPKIDYVYVEPSTKVVEAQIVRIERNGKYPSDHFPVTATIRF